MVEKGRPPAKPRAFRDHADERRRLHQPAVGTGLIGFGQTVTLCRFDRKAGIFHAERFKDPLPQDLFERLTADLLDHGAQRVDGYGILEGRAGS